MLRSALSGARRGLGRINPSRSIAFAPQKRALSSLTSHLHFTPTEEHANMRAMVRDFAYNEVEPQAAYFNRAEKFNHELYKKAGELGLLGCMVDPEFGGAGFDATAAGLLP